ncbi:MAG: addiction module protein [Phycisphaerales bacterium]|nr:addiction module protein [Phycisphaerales bacterium]
MTLKSIQTAAMQLPSQERSQLAAALLSSLESDNASELETMWVEEAEGAVLAPEAVVTTVLKVCENCGQTIGKLETPNVWKEHIVCAACYKKLA